MSEGESGPADIASPQGRWRRDCRDSTVNSGIGHPGYQVVQEEQTHAARQGFAKQRGDKSQGSEELRSLLRSGVWGVFLSAAYFCV